VAYRETSSHHWSDALIGVYRGAIRATGKHAVLHLLRRRQLANEQDRDKQNGHDGRDRDEETAQSGVFLLVIRHFDLPVFVR
jgi:hypothetical protein